MKERSIQFGASSALFGIVTDPASGAETGKPAVVILNAGLMHRIGPFRLHVALARTLARLGFTVMRVDCSGKGDSAQRQDAVSYREAARTDVAAALDYLQEARGVNHFMLIGLCSGADDAFTTATKDDRVSSLILLDGYAYRTPKFYLRRFGPKIISPMAWMRFIGRLFGRLRGSNGPPADDVFGMTFPPKESFATDLTNILDRNGFVLIVHTCGWADYYNYADQFADGFPLLAKRPNLRVEYYPDADHTYALSIDRTRLIRLVEQWCTEQWKSL